MNPEYRKPDGTSRAHLLPIDSELIGTAAFARARVRWGGQEWGSDELSHALDAETCLSSLAGMRVATLIESQFLSGLATLSLIERGAQCVPLNAAWRESEVRDVLTTLDVQVVIVERADCLASLLQQLPVSVHLLELNGKAPASRVIKECEHGSEHPDTEGLLILLSSGSTGKPKAIPLDQQQLQEAADEIIRSLDLDESDACLNFLPMMHIGGFLDQFLVPLRSGGKVVFADPHRPELALPLAKEERVTWIQGAPAMLNNLLRAGSEPSLPDLRFVRSVSAPLSREMLGRVENRFGAPVIEMYGMSETAGLITSNPLPPRPRKLGSVGVATDIAIQVRSSESIAENPGHGEIWVSGSRVIREYLADRGDTGVWEGEWFRTGDLGHMDEDGYLFLTGRLGDLINRGGQKFSPVELDEFCSAWPEASEAAAYGFAHPSLGQEVGLALVLAGEELDKQTVQERIAQELAPYKLPRRILFLDALPRNQNGKLQRHLLASMQAGARVPVLECSNESPTELESRLLDLWMQNLSVDELGIDDDYFESGGDSLSATTLLATLEKELGTGVAAVDFFECATVRKLAGYLEANPQNTAHTSDSGGPALELDLDPEVAKQIRRILQSWNGTPVFPGAYGIERAAGETATATNMFWCCNGRAEFRAVDAIPNFRVIAYRTLYELQAREDREIDRLCQVYAAEVERVQPEGPLVLGGFCDGAYLMAHVAKILVARGRSLRLFIGHDYLPELNLPGHHALVFSRGWEQNPFHLTPNFAKGLCRHFRGQFGLLDWEGGHSEYELEEFTNRLMAFLIDQLKRSAEPADDPQEPIRPQVRLRFHKRPPRLIRKDQEVEIELVATNHGQAAILPEDAFSVEARWQTPRGRERLQAPMKCALDEVIQPGAERRVRLKVVSHKPFRFETLKIGFLEDGLDWSWLDYGPPGTLTCTLMSF